MQIGAGLDADQDKIEINGRIELKWSSLIY